MSHPKDIVEAAEAIHADLLSYLKFKITTKIVDDKVVVSMPFDFHTPLDVITSFKMKNILPLSSREATYLWDRMIFRIIQSLYHGPPKTLDECQHLLAIGLTAYNLVDSKHVNQTRRAVVDAIINHIDDTFDAIDLPGFSAGRFTENRGDYFRRFGRMMVDELTR